MAADEHEPSGDSGDMWSAAFDPAANLRVLGDIQRRGLRAAGEIVERLVAVVDGAPSPGQAKAKADDEPTVADLGTGVDLWVEMAKRSLDVLGRLATATARSAGGAGGAGPDPDRPPTVLDVDGTGEQDAIELRVSPASPAPTTEVWLHNGTTDAHHDLRLHGGELRSSAGIVLLGGLTFDPELVTELPPRSSRGITIGVASGAGREGETEPGTYRGVVMVTGLPDVWLPVTVVVEP
jgi:hypothetical protein